MFEIGRTNERAWIVGEEHLATAVGSGTVDVLATPILAAFCEETARASIDPSLPEGERSVGTRINLDHVAPTPLGARVVVVSRLVSIDGRRLRFEIEARDEVEPIGRAIHERFIVDRVRFEERVARKANLVTDPESFNP